MKNFETVEVTRFNPKLKGRAVFIHGKAEEGIKVSQVLLVQNVTPEKLYVIDARGERFEYEINDFVDSLPHKKIGWYELQMVVLEVPGVEEEGDEDEEGE